VEAVSKCLAFSGYKAREDERVEKKREAGITEKPLEKHRTGGRRRETEPGKILVHQPAAPRSITIVFVLNGEYWTEKQGRNHKTEGD
jgi:hypothetical protein